MMTKNKFIYILIGAIILALLFWNRTFRFRLPRDIPSDLTQLSFILLLSTCLILFVVLVIIICKITPRKNFIFTIINRSFMELQKYITRESPATKNIENLQLELIKKLFKYKSLMKIFYIIVKFIQCFMALLLLFEVFYLHKIMLFYKLMPLLLLPLLLNYLIFTLNNIYQDLVQFLEERLELTFLLALPEETTRHMNYMDYVKYSKENTKVITIQKWISEMSFSELQVITYKFNVTLHIKKEYIARLFPKLTLKEAQKVFKYKTELNNAKGRASCSVYVFCILYTFDRFKTNYDYIITIFILVTYLTTWIFILITSAHTLPDSSFVWLKYLIPIYVSPFE